MRKNLKNIVEELKAAFKPKEIDFGRIYDAIHEMDVRTCAKRPGQTDEQWEQVFIEQNGTREEFIKERTKIREE